MLETSRRHRGTCNGSVASSAEKAVRLLMADLLNKLLVALGSQLREQGMELLQAALRGGQQLPDEVLHSIGHTGTSAGKAPPRRAPSTAR